MAFTTTDFDKFLSGEGWSLVEHDGIERGNDYIADAVKPFIAGKKEWDNYTDDIVYDADKAMREFIRKMSETPGWNRDRRKRTYRFKQLFRLLFGREYDAKKDSRITKKLSRVFAYYSTSIRTASKDDDGSWKAKPGYVISPKRLGKPPYSLRLRFEEMAAEGIIPTAANMKAPNDNLSAGHARNPKTEENMRRRSEIHKERYREYVKDRKEHGDIESGSSGGQDS